ncbi:MAG: vWA domain-containing protein [Acidimicrobiales bacterium]
MTDKPNLHIYFLLDRSGSMASMATDVIGGFNSFLAAQQADGPDAVLTLVQFDSEDPHEVVTDAVPIAEVLPLDASMFQPRGGTPLYDAMGRLITDATIRAESAARGAGEEILFVTFTDGEENQSREYTREKIFGLIKKREDKGWTFAFLGANQDAYAEAGQIGYSAANIQNFAADAVGTAAAFGSLSGSVARRRSRMRSGEHYDPRDLFEGNKAAEDDLRDRPGR